MSNFLKGSGNFFKSPATYFILPLALLVIYLVLANVDTMLERFGFETKGSIMAKLSEVRSQNRTLNEQLDELKIIIETKDQICKLREDAVDGHLQDVKDVNNIARKYINKVITDTVINTDKLVVTENTPYETTANEISATNFKNLHEVYNDLFGG